MDRVTSIVGQMGSGFHSLMGVNKSSSNEKTITEIAETAISPSNSNADSSPKPLAENNVKPIEVSTEKKGEASSTESGTTILNSVNNLLSSIGGGLNSLCSKGNSEGNSQSLVSGKDSTIQPEENLELETNSSTNEVIIVTNPQDQRIVELEDAILNLRQASESQKENLQYLDKSVKAIDDTFRQCFDRFEKTINTRLDSLGQRVGGLEKQVDDLAAEVQTINSASVRDRQENNVSSEISLGVVEALGHSSSSLNVEVVVAKSNQEFSTNEDAVESGSSVGGKLEKTSSSNEVSSQDEDIDK